MSYTFQGILSYHLEYYTDENIYYKNDNSDDFVTIK